MMQLKNILVPVDFSNEAELAVEWAVKLGKEERGSTIFLLNILFPTPIVDGAFSIESILQSEWEHAKGRIEEWRNKVPPPLSSVTMVAKGVVLDEILVACKTHDIDLVVMTTHGRHGISRVVHPNLTEAVAREAPCPVLVLHVNPKTQEVAKTGV